MSLADVAADLAHLAGARLQRLDVVDELELVLELRVPGRTFRVLMCARPEAVRLHLVKERPERKIPHGPMQAFLRTRLVGQKLARLELDGRVLVWVLEKDTMRWDPRGSRRALHVSAGGAEAPDATPADELPPLEHAEAAGEAAAAEAPDRRDARLRKRWLGILKGERKRLARLEKNLDRDLSKLAAYAKEGQRGEMLKTVLGQVKRGDATFRTWDWETGEEVEVALDPRLNPQANLQRFFERAKKAQRGVPRVEGKLEQVWEQLEAIDARIEAIESSEGAALEALALRLTEEGFMLSKGKGRSSRIDKVSRRFVAEDGTEIRVGRGAQHNDRLTFGFGKGPDIWLHARGTAGAHVLVKAQAGKPPSTQTLLDAAHLAVHYSSQKNETKAEVMIAEIRHVKKTKGAPAGLVGVSQSRTLLVAMEPKRLDRLYGRSEIGAPVEP